MRTTVDMALIHRVARIPQADNKIQSDGSEEVGIRAQVDVQLDVMDSAGPIIEGTGNAVVTLYTRVP